MKDKRNQLLPSLRCKHHEPPKLKLPTVSREQEHEWRELLQKQLAEHWLKLNFSDEIKRNDVILEKIRGFGGKVA